MSKPLYQRRLRPWAVPVLMLRAVSYLLRHWWLVLGIALYLSPVGPHLRIQYNTINHGDGYRRMVSCTYLGLHGLKNLPRGRCPVLVLMHRS